MKLSRTEVLGLGLMLLTLAVSAEANSLPGGDAVIRFINPQGKHVVRVDNLSSYDPHLTYEAYRGFACAKGADSRRIFLLEHPDAALGIEYLTLNGNEANILSGMHWRKSLFNGACGLSPVKRFPNTKEVFHLYNPANGDHIFTDIPQEKDQLRQGGWAQHASLGFGYAWGDLDNDGKLTEADAQILMAAVQGQRQLVNWQRSIADVDRDGVISRIDARLIVGAARGLFTLPQKLGDVTGNASLSSLDAAYISQIAAGSSQYSAAQRFLADFDGNGRVTIEDAHRTNCAGIADIEGLHCN